MAVQIDEAVHRDQRLWDALSGRPVVGIQIPTLSASRAILGGSAIFLGYSLRETTGSAAAQAEFLDGTDVNGMIVAEATVVAPLPGSVGNSDVDVDASSALAAAANNVTLAGVAGATTFITGFEITGDGATGASIITITVTGVLGGTKTYFLTIPAGVSTAITALIVEYARPIPASALNTAIVVNVPSFGAGNTNAAVTAHGFQRTVGSGVALTGTQQNQNFPGGGLLLKNGLFMRMLGGSLVGSAWLKF